MRSDHVSEVHEGEREVLMQTRGARRSKLTGNGDERRQCLWGGGSNCEQPRGGFARVLGGRCMWQRGDLIGARGEEKTE
jgi:hypothetical protein